MNSIQNLDLSDADFNLLLEGLEHLPSKELAGDIMTGLFKSMLGEKDGQTSDQRLEEHFNKVKERDKAKDQLKEDIRILQGKLLLLKRWLLAEGALKQVNDIVNPKEYL